MPNLPPAPKRRILVIEDEAAVRSILQRYISLSGYDAILTESAEEAMKLLQTTTPNLILLDISLPGGDGLVTLRQLHEKHETIPVIMLASSPDIPKAHAALNYGAGDFIAKPVDLSTLKHTLQVHLPPPR